MDNILKLLNDKNYHLEKFFTLNEAELLNFNEGNFDNLEVFYQSRETILDLVRCMDKLIEDAAACDKTSTDVSAQHKQQMLRAMAKKEELVTGILGQDLQILSVIEQAKSDIIRELRTTQTAKKAVGAYKSGDQADGKLTGRW